ncbi:MAG: hypothetical protein OXC30_01240 [Alphaproteobacteria bacterium]|nr:hypothetical protein [Alphaproteobacteria bacterium]
MRVWKKDERKGFKRSDRQCGIPEKHQKFLSYRYSVVKNLIEVDECLSGVKKKEGSLHLDYDSDSHDSTLDWVAFIAGVKEIQRLLDAQLALALSFHSSVDLMHQDEVSEHQPRSYLSRLCDKSSLKSSLQNYRKHAIGIKKEMRFYLDCVPNI